MTQGPTIPAASAEKELKAEKAMRKEAAPQEIILDPKHPDFDPGKLNQEQLDALPKTPGDKAYDVLQFTFGKALIMIFTAVLGFVANYGADKWHVPNPLTGFKSKVGVINPLKKFQEWFRGKLLDNPVFPLGKQGDGRFGEICNQFAYAAASTMVLFHGGNLFAPINRWLENRREAVTAYCSGIFGNKKDQKIDHARWGNTPQQTWGDVFKGRFTAWGLVFASFFGGAMLAGKGKLPFINSNPEKYRFEQYEEWFGRLMARISRTTQGKEIWNTPLTTELKDLNKGLENNKWYQFGRISALDFYATSIGILVWNFVSRGSAKKRQQKRIAAEALANEHALTDHATAAEPEAPVPETRYTDMHMPVKTRLAALVPAASHRESQTHRKTAAQETQLVQGL